MKKFLSDLLFGLAFGLGWALVGLAGELWHWLWAHVR